MMPFQGGHVLLLRLGRCRHAVEPMELSGTRWSPAPPQTLLQPGVPDLRMALPANLAAISRGKLLAMRLLGLNPRPSRIIAAIVLRARYAGSAMRALPRARGAPCSACRSLGGRRRRKPRRGPSWYGS